MEVLFTTTAVSSTEDLTSSPMNSSTDLSNDNLTFSNKTIIFPTPSITNILIATFLALMIIGCIFGNVLVILSVILYKPLRSVQNFFIVSLAVSDLSVAALVMPFHVSNLVLEYWIYGWLLCEIWLTLDVLLCTSSILNLCAIAVDRYWAIHDPLNYAQKRTPTRVGLMITAVWFTSAMVSIPPVFGWNESGQLYDPVAMECHLTDDRSYVIYSAFGSFYIPLITMTFIYFKIFLAIRRRLRKRREQTAMGKMKPSSNNKEEKKEQSPESTPAKDKETPPTPAHEERSGEGVEGEINSEIHGESGELKSPGKEVCVTTQNGGTHSKLSKEEKEKQGKWKGKRMKSFFEKKQKISLSKERKATRILGIVMVTFILCWLPFFLMYLILPFCASCSIPTFAELFLVWLGYVNSGLNPVIYTIFNDEFRKAFHMLLCSMYSKKRGREKTAKL